MYVIGLISFRYKTHMSGKEKTPQKNSEKAEDTNVPGWFFVKDIPIYLKRDVETALVAYVVDNEIVFGSEEFKAITLKELTPILRKTNVRWAKLKSSMMNTYKYPAIACLY